MIRHLKGKVRRPEAPAGYECESEDARKAWEGVHLRTLSYSFWFLCRRRPFCCRPSAGLCVPAGRLDAEDPWPVMFPVNKCLLACLCPVSLLWPSGPLTLPCCNPLWV